MAISYLCGLCTAVRLLKCYLEVLHKKGVIALFRSNKENMLDQLFYGRI